MSSAIASARRASRRSMGGFSLIEVLIALLVLALGLLGFALLQTLNLRYTQSANYRTEATNLASDLLDQMRANRLSAAQYVNATFAAGAVVVPATGCVTTVNAVTAQNRIDRWKCEVVATLGAQSSAEVTYVDGLAFVSISWGERTADVTETTFEVRTQL